MRRSSLAKACRSARGRLLAAIILGCSLAIIAVAAIVIAPLFESARQQVGRSRCARQLSIIGLAMQGYYDEHHCYPPAFLAGRDGKPAHSWRVLLLPYLGASQLYAQYRFDEPWDGPHNRELANRIPKMAGCPIYSCPADNSTWTSGETNYVVIRGKGTMFDGAASTDHLQIRDGTSSTVMVTEVTGTQIHWMEPRDLDLSTMDFAVGAPTGNNISSLHCCGAQLVFADAGMRCLSQVAREDDIRRLVSIAGSDPLDPSRMVIFRP
jgi:type II secretory pathway pseudopilin PulG